MIRIASHSALTSTSRYLKCNSYEMDLAAWMKIESSHCSPICNSRSYIYNAPLSSMRHTLNKSRKCKQCNSHLHWEHVTRYFSDFAALRPGNSRDLSPFHLAKKIFTRLAIHSLILLIVFYPSSLY
jgi:hypothetical protein